MCLCARWLGIPVHVHRGLDRRVLEVGQLPIRKPFPLVQKKMELVVIALLASAQASNLYILILRCQRSMLFGKLMLQCCNAAMAPRLFSKLG